MPTDSEASDPQGLMKSEFEISAGFFLNNKRDKDLCARIGTQPMHFFAEIKNETSRQHCGV